MFWSWDDLMQPIWLVTQNTVPKWEISNTSITAIIVWHAFWGIHWELEQVAFDEYEHMCSCSMRKQHEISLVVTFEMYGAVCFQSPLFNVEGRHWEVNLPRSTTLTKDVVWCRCWNFPCLSQILHCWLLFKIRNKHNIFKIVPVHPRFLTTSMVWNLWWTWKIGKFQICVDVEFYIVFHLANSEGRRKSCNLLGIGRVSTDIASCTSFSCPNWK